MWNGKEWKRITADEAAHLHPGGTVSAHSGLFMCELCGQYVLFTDGKYQVRHFRHSSAEKSKNCPERTFGSAIHFSYNASEHDLPIKIRINSKKDFALEIGFIQVPKNLISADLSVEIKANNGSRSCIYKKERFQIEGITYLSVGDLLGEKYIINVSGTRDAIYQYWPKTITGIDPSGTVFDAATGKKLISDSDVVVKKKYYILRRGFVPDIYGSHVSIKEVACETISWETWRVYEVIAKDYGEVTARFFLDFHCRLTENPVTIQTVWPICVETPYVVKHNKDSVVLYVTGNAPTTQTFPYVFIRKFDCSNGYVFEVPCNNKQQLISAGRFKTLQYAYYWKEPLDQITEKPVVLVTDVHGDAIIEGENNSIPDKKSVYVVAPYDGTIKIVQRGNIIEKRKLLPKVAAEIEGITWNMELVVCIGLDIVWRAIFIHKEKNLEVDEEAILCRLSTYRGSIIPIPHSARNLCSVLKNYTQIRNWLYKCIRSGWISEKAYRDLQSWITSGMK